MFEKVKEILSKYTENLDIKAQSILEADLGLCSFDLVSIVTDFEEEFDVEISDRDISKFVYVNDILSYLEGTSNMTASN